MLRMLPLLALSVILYNVFALGHGLASHDAMEHFLTQNAVTLHMSV